MVLMTTAINLPLNLLVQLSFTTHFLLYLYVSLKVIEKVMEWYRPAAVVLQCGGDSLSGDKLGCFNLSMKGKESKFVSINFLP